MVASGVDGDACHVRVTLCPWAGIPYDSSPIRRLKEPPLPIAVSRDLWSRMVWSREPCLIGALSKTRLSTREAVSPVGLLKPRPCALERSHFLATVAKSIILDTPYVKRFNSLVL